MTLDKWTSEVTERRLLGNLLKKPDLWHSVQADFRPDYFGKAIYRQLARTIQGLATDGNHISPTRVYATMAKAESKEVAQELFRELRQIVDDVLTPDELDSLMQLLQDQHQKRNVYYQLQTAMRKIEESDSDISVGEILGIAQEALVGSLITHGKSEIRDWQDVLMDVHKEWALAQAGKTELAFETGLCNLTSAIGGLRKKRQYLLAARTSMGKSALAMHMAKALAKKGRRSLIFTLEQSNTEFAQRVLSSEAAIKLSQWDEFPWPEEDSERLPAVLSKTMDLPISLVDLRRPSVEDIKRLARVEKAKHPDLALIVIDYLQEIDIRVSPGKNFATAVGDVAADLRALAGELDVAEILVSQLNRDLEKRSGSVKRPDKAGLRDSGRLEEVADTILFLYRHGYYESDMDAELQDITEVIIGKNRQGAGTGKKILVEFAGDIMLFYEPSQDRKTQYSQFIRQKEAAP